MASESCAVYENVVKPLLFNLDPEDAHNFVFSLLPLVKCSSALIRVACDYRSKRLETNLAGQRIANPVGLAAGFDKNGKLGNLLECLGFGFAEIGSVTNEASDGNAKPRLFRLPEDDAIINRMGLNGEGVAAVCRRLQKEPPTLPFGINMAKTNRPDIAGEKGFADIVETFKAIRNLPATYVVLNASCPNTHEGCMRETEEIGAMLQQIQRLNMQSLPVWVKMSPDSSNELLEAVVACAKDFAVHGFICGNTSISRDHLKTSSEAVAQIGKGGLSGKPVKEKALELCRKVASLKEAHQEIIGCGGIMSGDDAWRFFEEGASAVQLYTAMVYKGPAVIGKINTRLDELLEREQMTMGDLIASKRKVVL